LFRHAHLNVRPWREECLEFVARRLMVLHQLGGPEEFRVQQTPFPGCVVLRGWWGERLRGGWKAQAGEGGWACMQQCRKTGAWSE